MNDIVFIFLTLVACLSPIIVTGILAKIGELLDHRNFEGIEDWKECTCLKCRIEKFKHRGDK